MTKKQPNSNPSSAEETARKQRKKEKLALALKKNMQRRKMQAKARNMDENHYKITSEPE